MNVKAMIRKYIIHSKIKPVAYMAEKFKALYTWFVTLPQVELLRFKAYLDDQTYISKCYHKRFGCLPNLDHPVNFNEKNNWRKLNDRRDIYTQMVDKYGIKSVVAERVGKDYAFPLLGVWDRPEDIDFQSYPISLC